MAKTKEWNIFIDNKKHVLEFKRDIWMGKHKLYLNGQEIEIERVPFQEFKGIDQPIKIGDKDCRFILVGGKPDVVIDNICADSKKPYEPIKGLPFWVWLFVIANAAIPVVTLGGAIPAGIAALGAMLCVQQSRSPYIKELIRILICLLITLIAWGMVFLVLIPFLI